MTTINAVYRGGVLCPAEPLPLAEGAEVRLTVEPAVASPFDRAAWENRIRSAKTIQEWMDAANALPPTGDGYDLIAALNENRKLTGEQPISTCDESEQAR